MSSEFSLTNQLRVAGIVGAEASKFTALGKERAQELIYGIVSKVDVVVSGGCHLGGVDIWAEEAAYDLGRELLVFKPAVLNWSKGYMPRNLKIATTSHVVHNITVDRYPPDYKGMRFEYCYHCDSKSHIKSGGCWTMRRCKLYVLHIIRNED